MSREDGFINATELNNSVLFHIILNFAGNKKQVWRNFAQIFSKIKKLQLSLIFLLSTDLAKSFKILLLNL